MIAAGNDFDGLRLRARSARPATRRRRSPSARRCHAAADVIAASRRPADADLAAAEARRDAPASRSSRRCPTGQGGLGPARGDEHGEPAGRGRGRAAALSASGLDGRRRSSRRSSRTAPVRARPPRGRPAARGRRIVDVTAADTPVDPGDADGRLVRARPTPRRSRAGASPSRMPEAVPASGTSRSTSTDRSGRSSACRRRSPSQAPLPVDLVAGTTRRRGRRCDRAPPWRHRAPDRVLGPRRGAEARGDGRAPSPTTGHLRRRHAQARRPSSTRIAIRMCPPAAP